MTAVYLFQVDSAKENRPFFEGMSGSLPDSVYFRGLDFEAGRWTPDGVRVDVQIDEPEARCSVTLIELEEMESRARVSCRKYLPESSNVVLDEFVQYLDRVIKYCESKADSRGLKIISLRDKLGSQPTVVLTAGALRSATNFLEVFPFMDQQELAESQISQPNNIQHEAQKENLHPSFHGICKLDVERTMALRRCIMILDAVIRQDDHSSAVFHSWMQKAPLKNLLKRMNERPPALEKFILHQGNSGVTLDFEAPLSELVTIWSKDRKQIDLEYARRLIEAYFPTALKIRSTAKMNAVFVAASVQIGNLSENPPDK